MSRTLFFYLFSFFLYRPSPSICLCHSFPSNLSPFSHVLFLSKADAIAALRLGRLTTMEIKNLQSEHEELVQDIAIRKLTLCVNT